MGLEYKLLHIRRLGPRVERQERADDPVAELATDVALVVATEAEADSPDGSSPVSSGYAAMA